MSKVAVVGDCYVDVVCAGVERLPQWGADCLSSKVEQMPGGSAGNSCIQLAALGNKPTFVYCAGRDAYGQYYKRAMEEAGVKVMDIASVKPTGVCVVLTNPMDRAFVSCMGANADLTPEALALLIPRLVASTGSSSNRLGLLHFAGYFNCASMQSPALNKLIRELKAHHCQVSMDPQYDAELKFTGRNGHLGTLLPLLDLFMPNETELCAVAQLAHDSIQVPIAAAKISNLMSVSALLVVKLGLRGAQIWQRGSCIASCEAFKVSAVVDPTGAGDAFNGAFLFRFVSVPAGSQRQAKRHLTESIRWGCAAGAVRVSILGGSEFAPDARVLQQLVETGDVEAAVRLAVGNRISQANVSADLLISEFGTKSTL
eukprot:gb/GEZN01008807.1/.p1 GENE.gb/GEZN01008807.1/~~gb/GEZN01008807.1/.p1  ORF type:complete len:418 (+),score=35.58 gb/GEZN01008807.1/:144-1256(+)